MDEASSGRVIEDRAVVVVELLEFRVGASCVESESRVRRVGGGAFIGEEFARSRIK